MRNTLIYISLLFCFSIFGQEPIKILFIGNSYTFMNEMPKTFHKLAKDHGRKNVIVERNTHPGYSFREHTGREDMYSSIKKRKWDYVILQGFSREMSFNSHHIDTASVPYINRILDSIYCNNSCTNVMFYMTWGYDNGFEEREEIDTYDEMADSIRNGYKYIGDKYNLSVVPVGMVWKEIRNNSTIDLYHKDRAHPSEEGSFLIASTFYYSIFRDDLTVNEKLSVNEENQLMINQSVVEVVDNNVNEYSLNLNSFLVTVKHKKKSVKVICNSNFLNASEVSWTSVSGETIISDKAIFNYNFSDSKIVYLTVNSECGRRKYILDLPMMNEKIKRCFLKR